ncbi:AAA family ATPase [Butyrivibrio sp. XPD2002]|uniref:AAA family ATPase n=1 Tax=Butyrivibrio sp. XPD2002 TaxID=1280665 RepID=UPI0004796943|nr:AAA family ATPase [Butyrivibrio sp. XPD2002]
MVEETKSLLSAIQFDRYKSFKNKGPYIISFDPNITLIIGKNNSGKSNLIDALESSYGIKANKSNRIIDKVEGERLIYILDEEHLKYGFTEDTYSSPLSLNIMVSDYDYSRKYIGRSLICWITKGKEIENYLPAEAVNKVFHCKLQQIDQYTEFPLYIKDNCNDFHNIK